MPLEWTSIGVWAFFIVLAILSWQALHRKFLHPLRAVPGPWINAISELPAAINLVRGQQHVYYRALHEKYGPVVRVSPNELSFISVEAREEIYGHRKAGLMEKSPIFLGAVGKVDGQTGVSLALGAEHSRQRRALGYMFTNSALRHHEEILKVHVEKLMEVVQSAAAEQRSLDVSDWYSYLTFDIMGDLCFARPFGCLDKARSTSWSTSVISVFVAATYSQAIRRISGVSTRIEAALMYLLVPRSAAAWRVTHLQNSRNATLDRLSRKQEQQPHRDFVHQVLASESSKVLSRTELVLNIALFISAGTDTTATALAGWTYFLLTHPPCMRRLTTEMRTAFAAPEEITWQRVQPLRYLDATLREALRLFPPSAASQQRIVPASGAVIDGYAIPPGVTVAVSPWAASRSNRNFCKPDKFWPERWIEGEEEQCCNDRLGASVPFGNGPRVCVGRNLAMMEMALIAAHLLWRFDIRLDPEEHGRDNERWGLEGTLKVPKVFHSLTKPPLWVKFDNVER